MKTKLSRVGFYVSSLVACFFMSIASGCMSGGFKLTREYAGWVNSQPIILRIIIYILGFVIFAITLLIDVVVFNTMDFWQGHVSAGDYQFKDKEKTFLVHHEISPETGLKMSRIQIVNEKNVVQQDVVLRETPKHEIELYVDGVLRTKVQGITDVRLVSFFDSRGLLTEKKSIDFSQDVAFH